MHPLSTHLPGGGHKPERKKHAGTEYIGLHGLHGLRSRLPNGCYRT